MSRYAGLTGREYIPALDRSTRHGGHVGEHRVAHLFDGTFGDPGKPLCRRAYDEDGGYSIWRGNVGSMGICKVCRRRADAGLDGVDPLNAEAAA
jgi:hypothetical protein